MKVFKIALLMIACVCSFQFAQAQGVQLVNNSGCTVTYGFTWATIPGCGVTATTSQVLPPYSNIFINPRPGEKVITYTVQYAGSSTVHTILSAYCNGGPAGGSLPPFFNCTGAVGDIFWNDNYPSFFAPQEVHTW